MEAEPSAAGRPDDWENRPLDWARRSGQADRLLTALAARQRRQRRRRHGAAAALLIAVFAGGVTWWPLDRAAHPEVPPGHSRSPLVTGPERRTLQDGSVIEARPGTNLEVRIDSAGHGPREVILVSGEAHFQIAPNPARPFIVSAGESRFRAVGTAFSIAVAPAAVEMIVTEGRVAVDAVAGGTEPLAVVDAGHRALVHRTVAAPTLSAAPTISAVSAAEAGEKLAWRVPRLEFNETPLEEVVEILQRHSGVRLRLIGRDLRRIEITGALRADNIEPILHTLETHYAIRISRLPGGEIGLESAR
jgi:transmembrane sensor